MYFWIFLKSRQIKVNVQFHAGYLSVRIGTFTVFPLSFVATIFGEVMLKTPLEERKSRNKRSINAMNRKKATFIYQFLVNDLTKPYN